MAYTQNPEAGYQLCTTRRSPQSFPGLLPECRHRERFPRLPVRDSCYLIATGSRQIETP